MKLPLAVLAVLLLGGCPPPEMTYPDQCVRQRVFLECMAVLPKGPEHVVANDWSEVVSECASHALYTSYRLSHSIPEGCR